MKDFDLKQWLFENKLGAYGKASLNEALDANKAFADDTENRGDMNEVNPAALGVGQAEADAEMQKQDDENSDWLSLANETVGWATIEKPADGGLIDTYLDKLHRHDWYYRMSDDHRTYTRGQREEAELRQLYSQLSDIDKQTALNAYIEKAERYYPADQFPLKAQSLKTLTTKSFDGIS